MILAHQNKIVTPAYKVNCDRVAREGALGYKVNCDRVAIEGALGYKVNCDRVARERALGYKVNCDRVARESALGYKVNCDRVAREGALGWVGVRRTGIQCPLKQMHLETKKAAYAAFPGPPPARGRRLGYL